jgi:hypothetical protein
VFYVPCIRDDFVVLVSEVECSRAEHLVDDERPFPRGCELVPVFVALDSSKHQVTDLELAASYIALVIAPKGLLVPS